MDVFRIFAKMDGANQVQIADGTSYNVLAPGDELETGGIILRVYRRVLYADANPPEFHLFVERI